MPCSTACHESWVGQEWPGAWLVVKNILKPYNNAVSMTHCLSKICLNASEQLWLHFARSWATSAAIIDGGGCLDHVMQGQQHQLRAFLTRCSVSVWSCLIGCVMPDRYVRAWNHVSVFCQITQAAQTPMFRLCQIAATWMFNECKFSITNKQNWECMLLRLCDLPAT